MYAPARAPALELAGQSVHVVLPSAAYVPAAHHEQLLFEVSAAPVA